MTHTSMRRVGALGCGLACLLGAGSAFAQSKPFPHGGGAGAAGSGFRPTTVTSSDARSSYDNWKQNYLKTDCGNGEYRVEFNGPTGTTVSEGQGYGMVLTAYFGDKTEFDGLWRFAQAHFNSSGLMGWHVSCTGFTTNDGGSGSATDGDTDIGYALLVAADQWGGTYEQDAITYFKALKAHDYTTCSKVGRNMAKNGDRDTGCSASNSSYWMPGYMRVFQEATGDAFWGKAADDMVALWLANRSPSTGLVSNEVNDDGTTGESETWVDYNGCRIPWRAITDYLWYGTAGSKQVTDAITTWANGVGIAKTVDGYDTNGNPTGSYSQQNPWVGGFAAGAMSDSQALADAFATDFESIDDDEGGYYGSSLRTLYLLSLTGNFWKPGATATTADAGPSAAGGSSSSGAVGSQSSATSIAPDGGASTGGAPSGTLYDDESAGDHGVGSSGGCALGPNEHGATGGAALASALGLAWLGRRRRRPGRARPVVLRIAA